MDTTYQHCGSDEKERGVHVPGAICAGEKGR
jgi:hypothetical protein